MSDLCYHTSIIIYLPMPKINKVLAGALCSLALLGAGCAAGGKVDQSSAEAAVNGFLSGIEAGNKAKAKAYVDPASDLGQNFDKAWPDITGEINLKGHTIMSTEGDNVRVELQIEEDGKIEKDGETLQVVNKDGKWWVVDL